MNDHISSEDEEEYEEPREARRQIRKKISYIEPLEEPGTIYAGEVHGSAQRLLKVHRLTKYVKFCKCCALPQETTSVVVPFNCCDKSIDFGLGVYLYFYYIKFCCIMSIIIVCLSSIPSIVFSKRYSNDLIKYCEKKFEGIEVTNTTQLGRDCQKFIEQDISDDEKKKIDWTVKMSGDNIKYYYDIFGYGISEKERDKIDSIIIEYSLMYFLTGMTVLIANYLLILHIKLLDDYENFKETTPSDYAVLLHGVPREDNENFNMKNEVKKIVSDVMNYIGPVNVHQIIPCLRIGEIYHKAKKKYEEETKLYHVYNFEKQRLLNIYNGFSKKDNNLHYIKKYFCFNKKTPVADIQQKIQNYKIELEEMQTDLNKFPNKYNGGTFFLIFNQIKMKENFYDFFPHSAASKLIWLLRYFFQYLICGKCINDEYKNLIKLKATIGVDHASEAYEVMWENMGYSRLERNLYFFAAVFATILLIGVCLCVVYGLNYLQFYLEKKSFAGTGFMKYLISLIISLVISLNNYLAKKILEKFTFLEKFENRTNFFISYSIKLTVFQFFNTAVLPLASNYIKGGWGYNDILLNDMLMNFIINIFLPPLLFYVGPDLGLKLFQRTSVRLELENVKLEKSTYTQGKLNDIFENPKIDICYKYCYITNVILISLFYMSIFPIGMIFGFGGLLFTFMSEFFYMGLYKRPEVLNSRLCRFYVENFKWAMFVFSVGNYIFLGTINKHTKTGWALISLIVFFVLCLIPYHKFVSFNLMGQTEGDKKLDTYDDNSIFFSVDYEKLNPLTRKIGYTKYFENLRDKEIIEKDECSQILKQVQNVNEMNSYLKMSRNITNYVQSHTLNNILMQNKIDQKMGNLIEEKRENEMKKQHRKSITDKLFNNFNNLNPFKLNFLSSKKSSILETKKSLTYEQLGEMRDLLLLYSTTSAGISSALIFLGIKGDNFSDNLTHYQRNYNPWKIDWLYTEKFLQKRKKWISDVRKSMDYTGEISDEEDTFINYDETEDLITKKIRKINKENQIIDEKNKVQNMPIDDDKPMFDNEMIITGKANFDESICDNTEACFNDKKKSKNISDLTEEKKEKNIKEFFEGKNNGENNNNNNINNVDDIQRKTFPAGFLYNSNSKTRIFKLDKTNLYQGNDILKK